MELTLVREPPVCWIESCGSIGKVLCPRDVWAIAEATPDFRSRIKLAWIPKVQVSQCARRRVGLAGTGHVRQVRAGFTVSEVGVSEGAVEVEEVKFRDSVQGHRCELELWLLE